MMKDDDVSSSQHPSPIRHILCGICLSGSHHILYGWMDGHHFPPTCRLLCFLVFQTSRHILFREDGAHDKPIFATENLFGGATLPLGSRPPGSVAQCPGDTSLVIIPFARDHKTPAQDPTQPRHMAAAAQHQHRSGNQFGQLPPNPRCCSVVHNGQ